MRILPAINFASMSHLQNYDCNNGILNSTDNPVITYPVPPKISFISGQGLAGVSGGAGGSDTFSEKPGNTDLSCPVELTDLLGSTLLDLNVQAKIALQIF